MEQAIQKTSSAVIDAIRESLSKPQLHPRAREVLEHRLKYHIDKARIGGPSLKAVRRAGAISAKVRTARAKEKCREVLPFILQLRNEGLTYKVISELMKSAGIKNTRNTSFSAESLCLIVRRNAP